MIKVLRLGLLFAAAAAMLGQGESDPYFALASFNTFGSGGKPSISLSAWNVDALEFRVYRINDPVKFFQQLDDPHRFGTQTPQPPRERTMLENFRGLGFHGGAIARLSRQFLGERAGISFVAFL